MKAVVFEKKGVFAYSDRPMPQLLDEKDAIVRVTLSSICSSDLHIKHGSVPRALPGTIVGHEIVGVVTAVGDAVKSVSPGDRVTVNVETFCGECFFCKRGFINNCTNANGGWSLGCRIDGGQAQYVRVPYADNGLDRIPDGVTDAQALFVGDILATGYWGAQIADIQAGDTVAVLGAGPTGLCAAMCARLYSPANIVLIDPIESRLALAKQKGWANITVNPEKEDVKAVLEQLTDGRGADVVLEVAGGTNTFETAWRIARPNAVVCIIALYEEAQALPLPEMYGKNLIFKTGGVDAGACAEILRLISAGKIDASSLITHTFDLTQALSAYELFENRKDGVIKIALKP